MTEHLVHTGNQSNGQVYHHIDEEGRAECGLDYTPGNFRFVDAEIVATMNRRLCERCQEHTGPETEKRSLRDAIRAGEVETVERSGGNPWDGIGDAGR